MQIFEENKLLMQPQAFASIEKMLEDVHPTSFIVTKESSVSIMSTGPKVVYGDTIMGTISTICLKYFDEYVAAFRLVFGQVVAQCAVQNEDDTDLIKASQVFAIS